MVVSYVGAYGFLGNNASLVADGMIGMMRHKEAVSFARRMLEELHEV